MKFDLNCDLGEHEPLSRTRALMRWVTSANIACGGHAGDASSMARCVREAKRFGVRIGAHPGLWDRRDFGRGGTPISPSELELLLLHQVGALNRIVTTQAASLNHVKLHGALYHATEIDARLARAYLKAVKRWWPGLIVIARAAGRVARLGRRLGVHVWEEAFLDRGYRDDGSLVPRDEPGALLSDRDELERRLTLLLREGAIETVGGTVISIQPRTLCIHSDTPGSAALAKAAREFLESNDAD